MLPLLSNTYSELIFKFLFWIVCWYLNLILFPTSIAAKINWYSVYLWLLRIQFICYCWGLEMFIYKRILQGGKAYGWRIGTGGGQAHGWRTPFSWVTSWTPEPASFYCYDRKFLKRFCLVKQNNKDVAQ
jgi:hypothetical protein